MTNMTEATVLPIIIKVIILIDTIEAETLYLQNKLIIIKNGIICGEVNRTAMR